MNRITRIAVPALAALALSGCITYRNSSDGVSRARFDETANVGGPRVTPLTLIEDSRCPQDVQCVWAGQVRITARIDTGAGSSVRELTSGKPIPVADGTLELVEVMPAKKADIPLYRDDYRFGFRFSGGL